MDTSNGDGLTSSRRRGPGHSMPYFFVLLLLVAFLSFFQTVHVLSISEDGDGHAVKVSLEEFVQTGKRISSVKSEIGEKEESVDNPINLPDGNKTFSSCLLVMDDNHRLVEWIAYHYHVLPLRYLIVAVDPRSKTSPTKILNRWRRMGVYIEEWDDYKFMKKDIAKHIVGDEEQLHVKRDRHRMRQKNFYQACMMRMRQQGRSFTTLIDTDEFLTYNHKGGDEFENWEHERLRLHQKHPVYKKKQRIRPSSIPPTTAQEGALIQYIRTEQMAGVPFFQKPCISCPRLQFGAKESTTQERQNQVPLSLKIDTYRLDTIRYRKHADRQDFVKNGLAKVIVDVSRIFNFPKISTLHRPIKTACSAPWKDEWSSGLRINHYLGSWEAYSFRDDSRRGGERSFEGWAFKAKDADETDDNIRPWVAGFVESQGPEKARELLEGAGLSRGDQGNNKNWTILFLDEILSVNETEGNPSRVAFDNFVRDFHENKNAKIENIL